MSEAEKSESEMPESEMPESEMPESEMPESEASDRSAILLIAPPRDDPESDSSEDGAGQGVTVVDPADLAGGELESIAGARALIVDWNLGERCGLDLVEAIARDPHTCDVPLAMCSEDPTRVQVTLALRAGAMTFLHQPWEEEELIERLGLGSGDIPVESDTPEEPDTPEEEG